MTLSVHALAGVRKDLDDMRGASDNNTNKKHKEEMPSRIASDRADRNNLREALQTCLDPLIPMNCSSEDNANIYSGKMLINLLQ